MSLYKKKLNPFTGEFQLVFNGTIVAFKAGVATIVDLPAEGNIEGDARIVAENHTLYIWNGTEWENQGDIIDIDWASIENKPTSLVTDIDDAVTKAHTHANKSDLDLVSGTNTGDQDASTVDTDATGVSVQDALNTLENDLDTKLNIEGTRYLIVPDAGSDTDRGTALLATYATAKTMTPTESDPITVILPPGNYDLGSGTLAMDTAYIHIQGLVPAKKEFRGSSFDCEQKLTTTAENAITQVTNTNISDIEVLAGLYLPGSDVATKIMRVKFHSMPQEVKLTYSGYYEKVVCLSDKSFGYANSILSGVFKDCYGGNYSFGAVASLSGDFFDCIGGNYSFGGDWGNLSGNFYRCVAGDNSFGASNLISGKFYDCVAGDYSFGVNGVRFAAGSEFHRCKAGDYSFAWGGPGNVQSNFYDCVAGDYSFGVNGQNLVGMVVNCVAGNGSFGCFGAPTTATFINCTGGEECFSGVAGGSAIEGKFLNCTGGDNSWRLLAASAKLFNCKATGASAFGGVGAKDSYSKNADGWDFIGDIRIDGDITANNIPETANDIDTDATGVSVQDALNTLENDLDTKLNIEGTRYLIVPDAGSDTDRGTALLATYATAKTMTPTVDDPITVILLPGNYDLGSGTLAMDTAYIHIQGLVPAKKEFRGSSFDCEQKLTTTAENAITQVTNTNIADIEVLLGLYAPTTAIATKITRVKFHSMATNGEAGPINYAGYYESVVCLLTNSSFGFGGATIDGDFKDCYGGDNSFGYGGCTLTGDYTDCVGGDNSFGAGGGGIISGTMRNCVGGNDSFTGSNMGGTITGNLYDCIAGTTSFGSAGSSPTTGKLYRCIGGANCFGGGTVDALFESCIAGNQSFNFGPGSAATYRNCKAGNESFGFQSSAYTGLHINCIAGDTSFSSQAGGAWGTYINCIGGDNCYSSLGAGPATGKFINCTGGDNSFGALDASAKLFNCKATGVSAFNGEGAFDSYSKNADGWDFIGDIRIDGDITANNIPDKYITINEQETDYTLQLSDVGKLIDLNVASGGVTLTIPTNASVLFPIGTVIGINNKGTALITIAGATGDVEIKSKDSAVTISEQYAGATLTKVDTNVWYLHGDLS